RWRGDAAAVAPPIGDEDEYAQDFSDIDQDAAKPAQDRDTSVLWYEITARGFRLSRTPLDVAAPLAEHRARSQAAWVFTSATLAVGGRFEHYATKLGLSAPTTLLAPSPFDWQQQALCYLPRGLPEPAARGYTGAIVDALRPVLEASGGRAFVLFSSHRALR